VEPSAESHAIARPRWSRWTIALVCLGVCALYLGAEAYVFDGRLGFPLDDAWIHLKFAKNLAAGDGLSFNPGEPVTGTTAPLWTALLSILLLLPGGPVIWVKLLGIALFSLAAELVYRVARELDLSVGLSVLAAVLTATTEWMVWSALSGLEIPLFVVLSLIGILLHLRERRRRGGAPVSLAVLALAALARPEGQLLFVLACVDRLLLFERDDSGALVWRRAELAPILGGLAAAAILLVPMMAFNVMVGGSVMPTTFGAKVPPAQVAVPGAWMPSLAYLMRGPIDILFRAQPYMVLVAGAGLVALIARLGTARDRGLLLGAWLVGLPLAYAVLSATSGKSVTGNFGRYFFPLFPILIVVGVLGLERLAEHLAGGLRVGRARVPVRGALLVLLLVPSLVGALRGAQRYVQTVANVRDSNERVADWLRERIAPDAVLAVNDIGAFGFMLPNRIIDLGGIVHPEATRRRFEAANEGRLADEGTLRFLSETQPDYLVIFPSWFPALVSEGSPFTPIERFEIPNNITMFGDEIVVYSTPWTRGRLEAPPLETRDGN
jgi:hypothetical protein